MEEELVFCGGLTGQKVRQKRFLAGAKNPRGASGFGAREERRAHKQDLSGQFGASRVLQGWLFYG
jgi:hypothetical protein